MDGDKVEGVHVNHSAAVLFVIQSRFSGVSPDDI
jgi:hypothetical protein